jgi:hypothetical protein
VQRDVERAFAADDIMPTGAFSYFGSRRTLEFGLLVRPPRR